MSNSSAGGGELRGQARVIHDVRRLVDGWRGFPLGRATEPYPAAMPRYEPRGDGEHPVSETTRLLLQHWFRHDPHEIGSPGRTLAFKYWPHQRRTVETFVYLHEVRRIRRTEQLYELCGLEPLGPQRDPWAKLGAQLATGSGKTKIMSLLVAWAHFNSVLEASADLGFGRHALVIAPGLFVRDRLLQDFKPERRELASVFFGDPVVPRELESAWDLSVYSPADCPQRLDPARSVLVVTNYHQLLRMTNEGLATDIDPAERQLSLLFETGEPSKLEDIGTPLLERFVESKGLLVINDEAHHVGDEPAHAAFEQKARDKARLGVQEAAEMAWSRALRRLNGNGAQAGRVALQVDLSATLFEEIGAAAKASGGRTKFLPNDLFRHAAVHYGLPEAIVDGIVKRPVLERVEVRSADTGEAQPLVRDGQPTAWLTYRNLLATGIQRWRNVKAQLADEGSPAKPVLFVICNDKGEAAEVANYLKHGESSREDLSHREPVGYLDPESGKRLLLWNDGAGKPRSTVLEIHIGSKEESNEAEWNRIRQAVNAVDADEIPDPDGSVDADGSPALVPNPYNVVVSVMMLKEGWDVRNVKVIVPLRPCDSRTLTEQVLGRGLRKIHPPIIDDEGAAILRAEELYVIEHPSFEAILDQIDDLIERKSSDEISHARDYVPILQKEDEAERLQRSVRLVTFEGLIQSVHDWRGGFDVNKLPALVPRLSWHERIAETEIRTWLRTALAHGEEQGLEFTLSDAPSYRDFDHVLESAFAIPLLKDMRVGYQHKTAVKGVVQEFLERKVFALPAGVPLSFGRVIEAGEGLLALGNLAREDVIAAVQTALRQPIREAITSQRDATDVLLSERSTAELASYQAPNEHVQKPAARSNFDRTAFGNDDELRVGLLLDRCVDVEGWAYNHRSGVGWSIPYDWHGAPSKYYPDYVVRVRLGEVVHQVVIEVKGRFDDRDKAKARAGDRHCRLLADHDREPWHYLLLVENKGADREDISWWGAQSVTLLEDLLFHQEGLLLVPGEPVRDGGQDLTVVRSVPVGEQHVEALPVIGLTGAVSDLGMPEPLGWMRLRLRQPYDRSHFVARIEDDSLAPGIPRGSWALMRRLPTHLTRTAASLDGRRVVARSSAPEGRLRTGRWRVIRLDSQGNAESVCLDAGGRQPEASDGESGELVPLAEVVAVLG